MDEFSFKYIHEAELSKIVKQVKRERRKKNEDKEWEEYLERQKLKAFDKSLKQKTILTGRPTVNGEIYTTVNDDVESRLKSGSKNCLLSSVNNYSCEVNPVLINLNEDGVSLDVRGSPDEEQIQLIGLEKLNKLDKLRIFDCPEFLGSTCRLDSKHSCHKSSNRQEIVGNFYSHCNNVPKNACLPISSCLSVKEAGNGENDGDLQCKRSLVDNHLPCYRQCRPVDVHKSSNARYCSTSGFINLPQSGRTDRCSDISGKQSKVLPFDGELRLRVDNLKGKLTKVLINILDLSSKRPDFKDDEEIERKIKKTKEFISRFSRNYLYQLRRQVETIKKLNLSSCNCQTIYQKLFFCFQISIQALQAFHNILPDRSKLSSDKLVEFLGLILLVLEYSENECGDTYDNNEIKILCSTLITTFKNDTEQQEIRNERIKNLSRYKNDGEINKGNYFNETNIKEFSSSNKKKVAKKVKSPKKLSMYCSNGLPINWKKTSANLAKKKFGHPNKKGCGNLKEDDTKRGDNNKNKLDCHGESDLKTMNDDENTLGIAGATAGVNLKGGGDYDNLELPKDSEERTRIFLLFDKLSEMIHQSSKESEPLKLNNGQGEEKPLDKCSEISENEIKKVLLQIREMYLHPESLGLTRNSLDDKCPINFFKNKFKSITNNTDEKVKKSDAKNVSYTTVQFDEEEHKHPSKCKNRSTYLKNGEDKIPKINLQISDDQLESILKYRSDFTNYTRDSPFYKQFYERWSIVKRIGDNLLSQLLRDVAKELEITVLLQKMYQLEFNHQIVNAF